MLRTLALAIAPALALSLTCAATAQTSIVVPIGMATTEGNSGNLYPWGRGGAGLRIQHIYDSSHFTSQGVQSPILITRLRWRLDSQTLSVAGNFPTGVSVSMSTCPVDQSLVSANFEANQGTDLKECFRGPLTWGRGASTPGPSPFLVDIPLTTPFYYDPNYGDLNIEDDLPVQQYVGTNVILDVTTQAPLASRVWLTTGYPEGPGIVTTNHGLVVEITYTALTGLQPNFASDVIGGTSPLTVHFVDRTWTDDTGGVLSRAWDLDGDGVTDSTLPNPTFTYANCGAYNVTLTVTDARNGTRTVTRNAYVITDEVKPSFGFRQIAQNTYQFLDTSNPTPTSWAWDLDGDGITDSTLQNPVFAFATPCAMTNVTLTTHRNCRGPFTKSKQVLLAPATQTTMLSGGLGYSTSGTTSCFDMAVTNPSGVNICAMTLTPTASPSLLLGSPLSVDVWVTEAPGGCVANHANAAVWRQVASGNGNYRGGNAQSPIPVMFPFRTSFYLPTGTYGVLVTITGAGTTYSAPITTPTFTGPDLTISSGLTKSGTFVTAATSNRVWNGIIHYTPMAGSTEAAIGYFGAGCRGSLSAPPALTASSRPVMGSTLTMQFANVPLGAVVALLGFSRTASSLGALPLDLTALGAPGCPDRVSTDATSFVFGSGTTATWTLAIPNLGTLLGMPFFTQGLALDPTANALGGVMSDALALIVGR